jgi:hypothetical protein
MVIVEEVDVHVLLYPRMDCGQYLVLQKLGLVVSDELVVVAQFKFSLRPNSTMS